MQDTKRVKAIHNSDCLCYKCLQRKDKVHKIDIGGSGYGSSFDNFSTSLQLCDDCYKESTKDKPIWNMKTVYGEMHFSFGESKNDEYYKDRIVNEPIDQRYEYDDEMSEYLHNLPLESRELVYNRNAHGACADCNMDAQDWIDFELGMLPHEKCKEYGCYSPDEERAYEERFPTCQHPVEVIYDDGSHGCHCPFGAFGKCEDGIVSVNMNIWTKCYGCNYYKQRTVPVMRINSDDEADYNLYLEYQLNKDRLEEKFNDKLKGVL